VLVADDHAVVRHGLRALLESQGGIEVCCEASTGTQVLEHVRQNPPDLVILDLTMPEMNGLDVTRAVREQAPSTSVLVLTMHFSEELAREVLRAGAMGYVLKSDADTELLAAIDHIRHNQPFFTHALTVSMAQNFVRGAGNEEEATGPTGSLPLTNREIEVVQLLAQGKSSKQVALDLGISARTVESHRNNVMRKLNFRNFSELVRFAVRSKLVQP